MKSDFLPKLSISTKMKFVVILSTILIVSSCSAFEWIDWSTDSTIVPHGAFIGGSDEKKPLYVIKAGTDSYGTIPGKFRIDQCGYVSYGEKEIEVHSFKASFIWSNFETII